MMKLIDIALKDLKKTFTNIFSLVMSLGAPLLITGLLFFAFGSGGGEGDEISIAPSRVLVVNLDQGVETQPDIQAGKMLVSFLQDESLSEIMSFELAANEEEARRGVEEGSVEMAVIIPEEFSRSALNPGERAQVLLYQDPTLAIAPGILETLLNHFMDGFSGAKISALVAGAQFQEFGVTADDRVLASVTQGYADWLETGGHGEDSAAGSLLVFNPAGEQSGETDARAEMVGPIMAGMTVFFLFFMAANESQSIITEYELGTLARLFTTPTEKYLILGGKFLGVFLTLILQAGLLLVSSHFIFGIDWGKPVSVILIALGNIVLAAGFGILIMSFVQNTRQTGPVLGGVLTITGMLGGLFTNGIPDLPVFLDKARLMVPQGWAMKGWELSLAGASPSNVRANLLVLIGMGLAFFVLGGIKFNRRFS